MPECLESLTLAPALQLGTQEVAPCGYGCAEPPLGTPAPCQPQGGQGGAFRGPVLGSSAWERPRSPRAPCSWAQGCVWRGASSLCWLTFAVAPGGAGALTEHFVSPGAMLCFSPPLCHPFCLGWGSLWLALRPSVPHGVTQGGEHRGHVPSLKPPGSRGGDLLPPWLCPPSWHPIKTAPGARSRRPPGAWGEACRGHPPSRTPAPCSPSSTGRCCR